MELPPPEHDVNANYGGQVVGAVALGALATTAAITAFVFLRPGTRANFDAKIIKEMRLSQSEYGNQAVVNMKNKVVENFYE